MRNVRQNMKIALYCSILLCALDVFAEPADTNASWVVGRWVNVRAEISPTNALPPEVATNLTEKHVLTFLPDGNIQRYSVKHGLKNWVFKFKTVDRVLHLNYSSGFEPSGHLADDGMLVINYRRWHQVIYRKAKEDEDLGELEPKGELLGRGFWSEKNGRQPSPGDGKPAPEK